MAEYARIATFDVDDAALEVVLNEINSQEGPPDDLPATRIVVLRDRSAGKAMFVTRFASEDDLRKGSETLEKMSPPTEGMRRISVETYEVVLERQAP